MVVPDAQGIRAALLNVFRPGKEIGVDPEAFLSSAMIADVQHQTQTSAAGASNVLTYTIPAATSDLILAVAFLRDDNAAGVATSLKATLDLFINGTAEELNVNGLTERTGITNEALVDVFLANPTPASATALRVTLAGAGVEQTLIHFYVVRARFAGIELGQRVA